MSNQKAIDEFVATVERYLGLDVDLDTAAKRFQDEGQPDLDAALDRLAITLGDTASAEEIEDVRRALSDWRNEFRVNVKTAPGSRKTAWQLFENRDVYGGISRLWAALDAATFTWAGQNELNKSEALLGQVEAEVASHRVAVELAITNLDVEAARSAQALHEHAEHDLAAARVLVAKQRLERAEAYAALPAQRVAANAASEQQALQREAKARQALAAASRQVATARGASSTLSSAIDRAQQGVERHRRALEIAEADRAARVRQAVTS